MQRALAHSVTLIDDIGGPRLGEQCFEGLHAFAESWGDVFHCRFEGFDACVK